MQGAESAKLGRHTLFSNISQGSEKTDYWHTNVGIADTELERHPDTWSPDLKAYSSLAFPELISTGSSIPSFQALEA